jgi:hypothetical protein
VGRSCCGQNSPGTVDACRRSLRKNGAPGRPSGPRSHRGPRPRSRWAWSSAVWFGESDADELGLAVGLVGADGNPAATLRSEEDELGLAGRVAAVDLDGAGANDE